MRQTYLLLFCLLLTTACQQPKKEANKLVDSVQTTAAITPPITQSAADEPSPVNLVQNLYRIHNAQKGPFSLLSNRALLDSYFTKDLADLIWQDRQTSAKTNEVGLLNGDPLYNAQDMEVKDFNIYPATMLGDKAEVRVGFANFGKKNEFTFLLDRTDPGWRIGDILYGDGSQFYQLMSGAAEQEP